MTTVIAADRGAPRFELVTAGHHFLLNVLPFREPESRHFLAKFVATAAKIPVSLADLDSVLLRCLVVLGHHTAGVPSLVDRYLSNAFVLPNCLDRFSQCIENVLRYHCVHDRSVQQAIALVNTKYAESTCTPQFVAKSLKMRLPTLDVAFKREIGRTPSEYIRHVRLEHAAILLTTTNMSIKEIWSSIGYNHHSNFDHDFKRSFNVSPRDYRARALGPIDQAIHTTHNSLQAMAGSQAASSRRAKVLIIDDDEGTRTIIGTYLRLEGHSVAVAATATQGISESARFSPDVILLDYHLEDLNGLEFLQMLRSEHNDAPAVALFTADWDVFDRADEVSALHAVIASKLCDLERVRELVIFLSN